MKKIVSLFLAGALMVGASVPAFAANYTDWDTTPGANIYDKDGDSVTTLDSGGTAELEYGETYYIDLNDILNGEGVVLSDLSDKEYSSFSSKKEKNGSYLSDVTFKGEYKLDNVSGRNNYLKVTTKGSTSDKEEKVELWAIFKNKKDDRIIVGDKSGTSYRIKMTFWLSNKDLDDSIETGKNGIYKPDKNDENTVTWSDSNDDVAELVFDADDDADKFFAKLSTKADEKIYTTYADPINAELVFRSWNNVTIPSTNRATLTLFNPFIDDDDNVDVSKCRIYSYDKDKNLVDVTSSFKYNSDTEGWETKTRTLGQYIISDKELELEDESEVVEPTVPVTPDISDVTTPSTDTTNSGKVIPNTGRFAH